MVSSRGILVNSESISRLTMKPLLPWCTISSAKAKESESESVIEESLGTKKFPSLQIRRTYTFCNRNSLLQKIRSGEHIGISHLTFKKTKLSKESATCDHLLDCGNIPSIQEFTILTNRNNKFVLEIKESLLIRRDRPI